MESYIGNLPQYKTAELAVSAVTRNTDVDFSRKLCRNIYRWRYEQLLPAPTEACLFVRSDAAPWLTQSDTWTFWGSVVRNRKNTIMCFTSAEQ